VRRLLLRTNHLDDRDVAALAESPYLAELRELDLGVSFLGDEGVIALARSAAFPGLRVLSLVRTDVGEPGARALAESPLAGSLSRLAFNGVPLTRRARALLRDRFGDRVSL
jgi:hypothetical protein